MTEFLEKSMCFIFLLYNYESQGSGILPHTHEARTGGSDTIPYYETYELKKLVILQMAFGHLDSVLGPHLNF